MWKEIEKYVHCPGWQADLEFNDSHEKCIRKIRAYEAMGDLSGHRHSLHTLVFMELIFPK